MNNMKKNINDRAMPAKLTNQRLPYPPINKGDRVHAIEDIITCRKCGGNAVRVITTKGTTIICADCKDKIYFPA